MNEFTIEKDKSMNQEVIQLYGYKDSNKNRSYGMENNSCNCIVLCNGKKITTICNPGEYDMEKITEFEFEDKIDSIEAYDNYIVINNCEMINAEGKYNEDVKLTHIKNIANMQQIKAEYISKDDFIENENGCFCIAGLTEQERLQLYEQYGFSELYKNLESTIIERQEAEREEERKIEAARNKTNEYLEGKVLSLCHLRKRSSPLGKIIEADDVEFVENDNTVVLFETQEKGWGYGPVYDVGIINVAEAKKRVRGGKLHLDVPEDIMGIIIGKQGSNINAVTGILRKKGIDVSKIILHPKSREEIKITLESIEKAIREQKSKSHDE